MPTGAVTRESQELWRSAPPWESTPRGQSNAARRANPRLARRVLLYRSGEPTMPSVHKILVPVDFSDHSERALEEAIGLARNFDAELHLLHCYQVHPQAVSPYGIVVPETFEHDIRMAALQRLSEWRDKASAQGVRVKEHITAHFPSEEIAEMASRLGVDLIVMGTRGLSGLKHVLLGSVTERTIRLAHCPVLTVKAAR
jgi:nucleotide-binding universal stress UspA family protein